MACHEIAALRLAMMNVLGGFEESERAHELAELGPLATAPGPLAALSKARDLRDMRAGYETSLSLLEERLAKTAMEARERPYLATLAVFTKKVELDLSAQIAGFTRLCRELDEMHDFIHELYPGEEA